MGNVVYAPNTYAGEAYADKVFPALVPIDGIVEKQIVTPVPGVKSRQVLRTITQAIEFQTPSCDFTPQVADDISVGERYLDPVKMEVMREICFKDIKTSWDRMKLKKGALNDYVPPADEEAALIEHMNILVGKANEELYVKGKAGVTSAVASFAGAYPGLLGRLRADANVNKFVTGNVGVAAVTKIAGTAISVANPGVVTAAAGDVAKLRTGDKVTITGVAEALQVGGASINGQEFTITVLTTTTFSLGKQTTGVAGTASVIHFINSTNVIEALTFAYNAMPEVLRSKDDVRMPVAAHIERAYAVAQAQVANGSGNYFLGKKEMDFLGEKLIGMNSLPANTIGMWAQSNVFLGFDDGSDEVNLRITDMSKSTGDDKFRYKLAMQHDVNHLYGNEIFLVTPVIA